MYSPVIPTTLDARRRKILAQSRVAVAGLGGLGSHIALFLARAGVGTLHLIDFDHVEADNLHRQHYRPCDIGRLKTEAARQILDMYGFGCTVITDCMKVTADNAVSLFASDHIICEAFDVPETKAMLANTLLARSTDTILVTASGMAGYGSPNGITTRRISERLYLCGDGKSEVCPDTRLTAPRVALCAAHQALTAIRILLGETDC